MNWKLHLQGLGVLVLGCLALWVLVGPGAAQDGALLGGVFLAGYITVLTLGGVTRLLRPKTPPQPPQGLHCGHCGQGKLPGPRCPNCGREVEEQP